jgi:AraC-like DNA-binding protein
VRGSREKIQVPGGHSFRLLRWQRSLRDVESLLAPGQVEPVASEGTHWHFHIDMELTLFTTGEGTRFVGDHIAPFAAGDLILLGENLPHYWHTRGNSSGVSLQWHFPESHSIWGVPECLKLRELFERAGRGIRLTGSTAIAVSRQMHELQNLAGLSQFAAFVSILALLAGAPERDRSFLSAHSFALSAESNYQQAISKAMRHLIANFRKEVRLEDLLHVTDMSRPTFARQFKKHSGRSFSEFLNRLRLQAACRDLRQSDHSVLDIALSSGFTQLSFFNRLFRRELNCTPSDWRTHEKGRK